MNRYLIVLITALSFFSLNVPAADARFVFGGSWVDDYVGPPAGYTGVYSYTINGGPGFTHEITDAPTTTIDAETIAPEGQTFTIRMRNGNDQIPVGDPDRYSPWVGPFEFESKALPAPITSYTLKAIRHPAPPPPLV